MESLEAGLAAMRPGATCAEVFEAFATPVRKAGYEIAIQTGYSVSPTFPPRWGEGAGLSFLPTHHTVLQPGMVFHTPRGVRREGEEPSVVSETTLITDTGHRVLTSGPREFACR